jgi:type I restriction enzyme S subunit
VNGKTVPPGSVIISARGTVGLLGVATTHMALNQSCYGLIAKPGKLDNDFLYYLLKMLANEFSFISHGSIFDSITKDTFKEISAPIPPLDIQRRLAKFLSNFDEKIELLDNQNQTLESLAELEFAWRLTRHPGEMAKLEDLAKIAAGRNLPRSRFKPDGLHPVYGASGLVGRSDDYLYETDLLLTGRVGTLGQVWMIRAPERIWTTENTLVLTSVKHPHFVYFFLKHSKLGRYNSGSTQSLLRRCDLAKLEVKVPKQDVMIKFEQYAKSLFEKIHANNAQLTAAEKLRDGLLNGLLTGRLDLDP